MNLNEFIMSYCQCWVCASCSCAWCKMPTLHHRIYYKVSSYSWEIWATNRRNPKLQSIQNKPIFQLSAELSSCLRRTEAVTESTFSIMVVHFLFTKASIKLCGHKVFFWNNWVYLLFFLQVCFFFFLVNFLFFSSPELRSSYKLKHWGFQLERLSWDLEWFVLGCYTIDGFHKI